MRRRSVLALFLTLLVSCGTRVSAQSQPAPASPPGDGQDLFQTPPEFQGKSDAEIPFSERVRRRLPHRFQRLLGVHQVDDQRLRDQFDQAVEVLIQLQQEEIKIDAEYQREIRRRRTQRRSPTGPQDLQDLEPAHIPAVEILRNPLT